MKANRQHRVPLCGRALEILEAARTLGEGTGSLVFTHRQGKPLNDKQQRWLVRELGIAAVPHGFRASFRDWAAEETDHPREVIEAASAGAGSIDDFRLWGSRPCRRMGGHLTRVGWRTQVVHNLNNYKSALSEGAALAVVVQAVPGNPHWTRVGTDSPSPLR